MDRFRYYISEYYSEFYWMVRCQSPHSQLWFSSLVPLCEMHVDSVWRERTMFALPLLVSSTCGCCLLAGAANLSGGKNTLATMESAVIHHPAGTPSMQVSLHGMKRNVSDLRLQLHHMKQLQVWLGKVGIQYTPFFFFLTLSPLVRVWFEVEELHRKAESQVAQTKALLRQYMPLEWSWRYKKYLRVTAAAQM